MTTQHRLKNNTLTLTILTTTTTIATKKNCKNYNNNNNNFMEKFFLKLKKKTKIYKKLHVLTSDIISERKTERKTLAISVT